jgi:hypothetical protein
MNLKHREPPPQSLCAKIARGVFAVLRAVLGFIIFGFFGAAAREAYLQVLMSAAMNWEVLVAITGHSTCTWTAIGLYVFGVVLFILYLVPIVSRLI